MFRSFEKRYEEKAALNKIAQLPTNKKFKYLAIAFGTTAVTLLIIMFLCLESFSLTTFLVLRGCVGLFAILFMIFVGCYTYRVYYIHYKQKR